MSKMNEHVGTTSVASSRKRTILTSESLSLLTKLLSAILVALGALTAITTALIVIRTYSPVFFGDQWLVFETFMRDGGHITWSQLWAQHNEHRIPFGRLAFYVDLICFRGRNVSLLVGIYVVQSLHLLVFVTVLWRFGRLKGPLFWTAFGFATFCIFSPIQYENFVWGFQLSFVLSGMAASAAFACAIWYAETAHDQGTFTSLPLFLCILAAVVAEFSLSNGILTWPVLSLLALNLRFPIRAQCLLGAAGFMATAIYLQGYSAQGVHSNPFSSFQHPLAICRYVITYLASTWNMESPYGSIYPLITKALVSVVLIMFLFSALGFLSTKVQHTPFETFLLAEMIFVVATATITALGRVTLGFEQAAASRYQTIALVFWACFVIRLLTRSAQTSGNQRGFLQIQLSVLALVVVGVLRTGYYDQCARDRQVSQTRGFTALIQNSGNEKDLKLLFPRPRLLIEEYEYLHSHSWGPDVREFGGISSGVH